jgi:antitoxin (DNA-binding transcriptional repressor) of toxin-antitoxin stability system
VTSTAAPSTPAATIIDTRESFDIVVPPGREGITRAAPREPSTYGEVSIGTLTVLTCRDYHLVMNDVRIADLKARLSEHLRSVRNGATLTVLDRDTPVARIVPYIQQPLEIRKAKRPVRDLKLPPKPAKRTDSVAIILDDRRRR